MECFQDTEEILDSPVVVYPKKTGTESKRHPRIEATFSQFSTQTSAAFLCEVPFRLGFTRISGLANTLSTGFCTRSVSLLPVRLERRQVEADDASQSEARKARDRMAEIGEGDGVNGLGSMEKPRDAEGHDVYPGDGEHEPSRRRGVETSHALFSSKVGEGKPCLGLILC